MRVLVVGAGVGGLTSALTLSAAGHAVTVFERSEAFADVGAGVQLGPNATRVLIRLGLGGALRAAAFEPSRIEVRARETGDLLLTSRLGAPAEARWGAPYLQLHRADLHRLLLDAALAAGVEVRCGCTVASISSAGDVATVQIEGAQVEGGDRQHETADLVVACDGVRSVARSLMFGATPARFTGQIAWRGLVPAEKLEPAAPREAMVWTGSRRHLVLYPIRRGELLNVVGVVDNRDGDRKESWSQRGSKADFAKDFEGWPPQVATLIAAMDQCGLWAIHARPPLPVWFKGRVALLGDAAHPMVPFLAQGAGMAIEDAECLARRLSRAPVDAALGRYTAERRVRVAKVAAWSRRNGQLFHLPLIVRQLAFGGVRASGSGTAALDWLYGYDGLAMHD